MWIVIDTNQTWELPTSLSESGAAPEARGITVPPFVLAELLLLDNPKPRLKLLPFRTRVGFTPFEVVGQLAGFQVPEIVSFEPFLSTKSPYQDQIVSMLRDPTPSHEQWAKTCKESNRKFGSGMQPTSKSSRNLIRDMVARGKFPEVPKFSSFEMLMNAVGVGATSFLGSVAIDSISENGQRPAAVADPDELYAAVMQNPYLSRFFKTTVLGDVLGDVAGKLGLAETCSLSSKSRGEKGGQANNTCRGYERRYSKGNFCNHIVIR